jgi:drug/metabolite transporter (DMT)-like permease
VFSARNSSAIAGSLVFATMLWGANNAGMKHLVQFWPPVAISSGRFILCGVLMLALLQWTRWLGTPTAALTPAASRHLWTRTGLSLAVYVVSFMVAIKYTSPANVALYLGASPVWALLLEGRSETGRGLRWLAALLAVAGAATLFWPSLALTGDRWFGECAALLSSVLWALYGHLARGLSGTMTGAELTARSMWRAGLLLAPFSFWELSASTVVWRWDAAAIFAYSVLLPGIVSFGLWAHALKLWPTSKVYLFNNLIPIWTVFWTWLFFGDAITANVWLALILIVGAVVISQTNWEKVLGRRWLPPE